jgi:hypothetical protein
MMLSNLFRRHKTPAPRFAPGLFLGLIVIFAASTYYRPVVGLTGLGVTAIIIAVMVELNGARIWDTYRKSYKKRRGMAGVWSAPNKVYYDLNVRILWPFVGFLGLVCLWAAYSLA